MLALGGYVLEIPGARLVTHERVPVPRFNYVEEVRVSPERQAAFFERALDHYFQRSLRPTVRLAEPVPPHLDRGLRAFAFRPAHDRLTVLAARDALPPPRRFAFDVEAAGPEEVDRVAAFFASERERGELRRAIEVVMAHPNPGEELRAFLASEHGRAAAAALLYRRGDAAGIHFVATQPPDRGRGAASALVDHLVRETPRPPDGLLAVTARHPRIRARLEALGFEAIGEFVEYELPADAELALAPPGPPQPPRWRPPRGRAPPEGR